MEQLNGNIHYQIFCGIRIHPAKPLTDYKFIDKVIKRPCASQGTLIKNDFPYRRACRKSAPDQ